MPTFASFGYRLRHLLSIILSAKYGRWASQLLGALWRSLFSFRPKEYRPSSQPVVISPSESPSSTPSTVIEMEGTTACGLKPTSTPVDEGTTDAGPLHLRSEAEESKENASVDPHQHLSASSAVERPAVVGTSSNGLIAGRIDRDYERRSRKLLSALPSDNDRIDQPAGQRESSRSSTALGVPKFPAGPFRYRDEVDSSLGLSTPEGWVQKFTTGGFPFFVHPEQHFITDTYIRRPELFQLLRSWSEVLQEMIDTNRRDSGSECVWPERFEIYVNAQEESCHYYFISHDDLGIFWLESFHEKFKKAEGWTGSRIELFLKSEYWAHMELFPYQCHLDAEAELRDILIGARFDVEVSPGSTSPYSSGQCSVFLEDLERLSVCDFGSAVKVTFLARLMKNFHHNRVSNYFGDEGVRFDRAQPSPAALDKRLSISQRFLFSILHFLVFRSDTAQLTKINEVVLRSPSLVHLFRGDTDHLTTSQKVVQGSSVLSQLWHSFLLNCIRNTEQSNIVAALIFTSDVGILSINGLNRIQSNAALVSALCSLASLIVGLHQVRQHTVLLDSYTCTAGNYFENAYYPQSGFRVLAVLFCLPFALLVWSVIAVAVAINMYAFQTVDALEGRSGILFATATVFLSVVSICALCFFWRIWELRRLAARPDRG